VLPGFRCGGLRNRRLQLLTLTAGDEWEWALPLVKLLFEQLVGELAFALFVLRALIVFVFHD
jgi:hypothetical protein